MRGSICDTYYKSVYRLADNTYVLNIDTDCFSDTRISAVSIPSSRGLYASLTLPPSYLTPMVASAIP